MEIDEIPEQAVNETVFQLVLPFLDISDLLSTSSTCKFLLTQARKDNLWKQEYQNQDSKIARTSIIDEIPESGHTFHQRALMSIPPRAHGAPCLTCLDIEDATMYHPHPRDRHARRHPGKQLYYILYFGAYADWALNADGDLVDCFINGEPGNEVYLPREFPVYCSACQVSLGSSQELFDHCKRDSHICAVHPELMMDPRLLEDFEGNNIFERTRALKQYQSSIQDLFYESITENKNLMVMQDYAVRFHFALFVSNAVTAVPPLQLTLEFVTAYCASQGARQFLGGNKTVIAAHFVGWSVIPFQFIFDDMFSCFMAMHECAVLDGFFDG